MRGPDTTRPTPAEDWREATVDVIIPALNEEDHIVLCLESVTRQTLRPRRIVLVDDGSSDGTVARARAFCALHGVELVVIPRRTRSARHRRSSDRRASWTRMSSSFSTRTRSSSRRTTSSEPSRSSIRPSASPAPAAPSCRSQAGPPSGDRYTRGQGILSALQYRASGCRKGWIRRLALRLTNIYREVLYLFLQRFVYRGQMAFFGTTINPVGCAVAYRRKYLKALFDTWSRCSATTSRTPRTSSSASRCSTRAIGTSSSQTYTPERSSRSPAAARQVYLWSSSFLQSCYYFDALLRSPFKALKRWRNAAGGGRRRAARRGSSVRNPRLRFRAGRRSRCSPSRPALQARRERSVPCCLPLCTR